MFSFLSFIPIIGKFFTKGLDVISELVEDKDLRNKLQAEFKKLQLDTDLKIRELELEKRKIELDEVKDRRSLLKTLVNRNAIPINEFFYVYLGIIVFNTIVVPLATSFGFIIPVVDLPKELSSVVNVMVVSFFGYKGGKKVIESNNKK